MLQNWEHSAILSTFIKLSVAIKTFILSIFEWPFYTGFTVFASPAQFNSESHPTCNRACNASLADPLHEDNVSFLLTQFKAKIITRQ